MGEDRINGRGETGERTGGPRFGVAAGAAGAAAALAAVLMLAAPFAGPAEAQDGALDPPERFAESFVGDGLRSLAFAPRTQSTSGGGRFLTGLRIGEPPSGARVDLASLRVALPPETGARLCVDLTTIDNRYTAESTHAVTGGGGAPALGLATAYADALSGYRAQDLLVFARRAERCDAATPGVLAPAILGEETLVASVNIGRGRPTAQLFKDGAAVTERSRCSRDEQAAKSHDCAVPVAGLTGGVYELRILTASLTGADIENRYDVALP